ncbi:tRNA 2-thiouridine(34) synthase MnmA [Candidatus Parcubacteria bacterium]|nr:MAG: tRNA 2-thiouridine(34) synthase MnmA [Candidatus Parcubacteria bacterium]
MSSGVHSDVLVGLSGGVDSAVAALLLKERGKFPHGVFLRTWTPPHLPCSQDEDRLHAIANAVALGIPFMTLDTKDAYYEKVFLPMIEAYKLGLTPNPDIWCNQSVKFLFLFEAAQGQGACFATGHYARREEDKNGAPLLRAARDAKKDQTYFLSSIPRGIFSSVLFPLSDLLKEDVRAIAREHNLPSAHRRDSVGLCFLGTFSLKELLAPYLPLTPGPVVNLKGEELGWHEGLALYTIGQRHGFFVTPQSSQSPVWYVVAKIPETDTLVVHTDREVSAVTSVRATQWNWLVDPLDREEKLWVRYRHGQPLQEARLCPLAQLTDCIIEFAERQVAVAPGQWIVAYRADGVVVGGGTIAAYPYPALKYLI